MIAKSNPGSLYDSASTSSGASTDFVRNSIVLVIWRRRWTLLVTVAVCLVAAMVYLAAAIPIFTSSSSIFVDQQDRRILTDNQGMGLSRSDSFLFTQAEIIRSAPILSNALDKVNYRSMKTFARVDNPIAWLQLEKDFKVDVGKKDDVITVSMDSPYPDEAAELVNSIVDAYMTAQGKRKKSTAAEVLKILNKEKEHREQELADRVEQILKFKRDNPLIGFQTEKGNIIIERLARLSDSLTTLELETVQAETQFSSDKAALADPERMRQYVQELQLKSQQGDKEYDALRDEMVRARLVMATYSQTHGAASDRVTALQGTIRELERELREKEKNVVLARVTQSEAALTAAREKEAKVRASFEQQQKAALDLNGKTAEYSRLVEEKARLEKQCEILDSRVKEVGVNSEEPGAMNIQVLEAARAEDKPTKPRKAFTLAGALLVGLLAGSGLALLRDWLDHRIRSSEEVSDALGIRVLGVVPQIGGPKSFTSRGLHAHSDAMSESSEAYRTIRTAIHFGAAADLKTILVTSPSPGDGKSTTASNLATVLAQAGYRTLLLDADLRKPSQHSLFGVEQGPGLCSVVSGQVKLARCHPLDARDPARPADGRALAVQPIGDHLGQAVLPGHARRRRKLRQSGHRLPAGARRHRRADSGRGVGCHRAGRADQPHHAQQRQLRV